MMKLDPIIACGVIGALLGYGYEGTLQAACYGAGIGMALPIVVTIALAFLAD